MSRSSKLLHPREGRGNPDSEPVGLEAQVPLWTHGWHLNWGGGLLGWSPPPQPSRVDGARVSYRVGHPADVTELLGVGKALARLVLAVLCAAQPDEKYIERYVS